MYKQSPEDYNKLNVGCYLDSKIEKITSDSGWIKEGPNTPDIINMFIEYQKMKALDQIAEHLDALVFKLDQIRRDHSDSFWLQNEAPPQQEDEEEIDFW